MFEKIAGVQLQGGFFDTNCTLMFFEPEKRASVIYGKNGSGKSSIAKAIYHYSKNIESDTQLDLLGHDKQILLKHDDYIKRIYVFNEDFIHNEIRFTNDGKLNAIVLFGEEKELDDKITELEKEKANLEKGSFAECEKKLELLLNKNNINSPDYHKQKIRDSLRVRWAKREQEIRQLFVAGSVTENLIKRVLESKIEHRDEADLNKQYQEKIKLIHNTKDQPTIESRISMISFSSNIDDKVNLLLLKTIKKPELNEREKIIFDMIQHQCDQKQINNIKNHFSDSNTTHCPFCFQSVSEEYKAQITRSIINVFSSEEAQKHQQEITDLTINEIKLDLSSYEKLDALLIQKIDQKVNDYNEQRKKVIAMLEQKKTNVYVNISNFQSNLGQIVSELNNLLSKLEKNRQEFNQTISGKNNLVEELQKLSYRLALLECEDHVKNYHKQLKEKHEIETQSQEYEQKINQFDSDIKSMQAKKVNIDLAIDVINRYLSYIFFSADRLKVEIDNGKYSVIVRGKKVSLKKLSEGEKNVIALCYFFSTLLANKQAVDFYKESIFVVLDDPISSFDFTNKIGIYSFLRKIFCEVFSKNLDSRILILTHQVESVFHFEKVCTDLALEKSGIKINLKSSILEHKALDDFKYKKYHEYSLLLNTIFDYASQEKDTERYDETIGNIMRRILEGFSTFNYKKGIDSLSCNQEILSQIKDEKKREYFYNLMYRLVLNSESHFEEQIKDMPNTDILPYISREEKIRTAREILIYLNLIHPLHIKFHLEENEAKINTITAWEKGLMV